MKIETEFRKLIEESIINKISDIYILPAMDEYVIKVRNQKVTKHFTNISSEYASQLMNYCKFISNMALSEQRRPQMGSVHFKTESKKYFLRISTVGNFKAKESLVIRIIYPLDNTEVAFFNDGNFTQLREISKNRGLVLFAGPTGSGKTTTIYNLAKEFSQKVVMTIEDPVEIQENSFLQLQVNEEAGMSYSELIKVGLRHRPDIFIIGEIRDKSTAKAAIRASLSGHLVMSTIHAKDPIGVIKRLSELEIEDDFIDQSISGIIYQRLIPDSRGQSKCLMIMHDIQDLDSISKYEWQEWQNNLDKLEKHGEISSKTRDEFYWG